MCNSHWVIFELSQCSHFGSVDQTKSMLSKHENVLLHRKIERTENKIRQYLESIAFCHCAHIQYHKYSRSAVSTWLFHSLLAVYIHRFAIHYNMAQIFFHGREAHSTIQDYRYNISQRLRLN